MLHTLPTGCVTWVYRFPVTFGCCCIVCESRNTQPVCWDLREETELRKVIFLNQQRFKYTVNIRKIHKSSQRLICGHLRAYIPHSLKTSSQILKVQKSNQIWQKLNKIIRLGHLFTGGYNKYHIRKAKVCELLDSASGVTPLCRIECI